MAKKHLILAASVAAALAVGAPMAMAAESPLPALPPIPGVPALPASGPVAPNDGDCSFHEGHASTESDAPALQAPVAGTNDESSAGNCVSSGNEQGNGLGGGMAVPSLPAAPQ